MLGYGLHKGGTTRRAFLRGAGAAACCLACAGVAPLAGCGAGVVWGLGPGADGWAFVQGKRAVQK